MAQHHGFPHATDDGHRHEVDPNACEAADDTTIMVSCHKCGARGGISLSTEQLDELAQWEDG